MNRTDIPNRLLPLYDFLLAHLSGGRAFCSLDNGSLGSRAGGIASRTVTEKLTELEKLGLIMRTRGHPEGCKEFDPMCGGDRNKRRIYLAGHPHVAHLRPLHMAPDHSSLTYGYDKAYPDVSPAGVPRPVRHDTALSTAARCVYTEIHSITAEGHCKAPYSYYEQKLGIGNAQACFRELYDRGHIWLFRHGDVLMYGTMAGLHQNLAMAAGSGNAKQVGRLQDVLRQCSVQGGVQWPAA